jgi:hypothetical protein
VEKKERNGIIEYLYPRQTYVDGSWITTNSGSIPNGDDLTISDNSPFLRQTVYTSDSPFADSYQGLISTITLQSNSNSDVIAITEAVIYASDRSTSKTVLHPVVPVDNIFHQGYNIIPFDESNPIFISANKTYQILFATDRLTPIPSLIKGDFLILFGRSTLISKPRDLVAYPFPSTPI